jgi:tyrosyl-tRNA synthetase
MSYLKFLREVGKHITVNQMMAKETVKKRIEDPDKSISYTEFSYMLLQGYDFVRLYEDK